MCGAGTGPGDLVTESFPTRAPEETLEAVVSFFRGCSGLQAVGIGSFGPVCLHRESAEYGHITSTPKLAWQNFDLAGSVSRSLGVPAGFDTDVNAAALGEAEWGAARGLSDFLYLTVGTGIGGGAVAGGRLLHGLMHPEMGHIRVPRDSERDPFPGVCPFHGDCLEGLASGPAIESRWGKPARQLAPDHPAWALEAHYLALALVNWVCTLSPKRIVMGGGIMQQVQLFPLIRAELAVLLNGYIRSDSLLSDAFVAPPELGNRAGVLGAMVLARQALLSGTER